MPKPTKKMQKSTARAATAAPAKSVTGTTFCAETGLSRQRLSRYVATGVIPRNDDGAFPWPDALHALVAHLSEVAAGRGGGGAQAALAKERAALARAQREAVELKSRGMRDDYVLVAEVSKTWDAACTSIRCGVMAIPSRLPERLPHLSRHDLSVIDDLLRETLTALADGLDEGEEKA